MRTSEGNNGDNINNHGGYDVADLFIATDDQKSTIPVGHSHHFHDYDFYNV